MFCFTFWLRWFIILFYQAGRLNSKDLFYKHGLAKIRASQNKQNKKENERREK